MSLSLPKLNLATMPTVDGGVTAEMFQANVRKAVKDCIDRPADKRPRIVTLQMKIVPVMVVNGNVIDCDGAKGTFNCKTKIPDYETRELDFGVQNSGDLYFNPDSPNDHRQMTLLDGEAAE
jgi:hypothetical protein